MKPVLLFFAFASVLLPSVPLVVAAEEPQAAPAAAVAGATSVGLSAPSAEARLAAATQALFLALAEAEFRHVRPSVHPDAAAVRELLRLSADFRREMMCWGRRSLTEVRLQRWLEEDLSAVNPDELSYEERPGWIAYLRSDAEEALADYEFAQKRLRRRAAAIIRRGLDIDDMDTAEHRPAEPAWRLGEPMPAGTGEAGALLYRLRDSMAFVALARPVVEQPPHEQELCLLVCEEEMETMDERFRSLPPGKALNPGWLLWYKAWWMEEAQMVKLELLRCAGVDAVALTSPPENEAEGRARVEAEVERLRLCLEAAEKQLPTLPAAPSAACRRLLAQLMARWTAYAYTLRRWGNMTYHRSFVWNGGCMGYRSTEVWGEHYYTDFSCQWPQDGQAPAEWLSGFLEKMRQELNASLEEHRHPVPRPPMRRIVSSGDSPGFLDWSEVGEALEASFQEVDPEPPDAVDEAEDEDFMLPM